MYLDVKLEIYYAILSANLRKRIEKFLYDSLKSNIVIIDSYKEYCGFHHYRIFICEEAVEAKWLETLMYAVNSYDRVSHCKILRKRCRRWRNPFKSLRRR